MGWASGSELLRSVWSVVKYRIPSDLRKDVLKELIVEFKSYDCDTICECFEEFPEMEEAYNELYPRK